MDPKISKIRQWRIELCPDVCGGVQLGCGEGGEHVPHSIGIGVGKTSMYSNFCENELVCFIFTTLESAC